MCRGKARSAFRHEIGRLLSDREGNDSGIRVRDGDFHGLADSSALSVAGKVDLQVWRRMVSTLNKRCDEGRERLAVGPESVFCISISFMLAPAPLLGTPKALNCKEQL
jgi:hypothetical protein